MEKTRKRKGKYVKKRKKSVKNREKSTEKCVKNIKKMKKIRKIIEKCGKKLMTIFFVLEKHQRVRRGNPELESARSSWDLFEQRRSGSDNFHVPDR